MAETLEKVELEIIDYMNAGNISTIKIAGYLVIIVGDSLELEKLPFVDLDQLEIEFPDMLD